MDSDVVDIWVNLTTPQSAAEFLGNESNANIPGYLGGDGSKGVAVAELIDRMDANGVDDRGADARPHPRRGDGGARHRRRPPWSPAGRRAWWPTRPGPPAT